MQVFKKITLLGLLLFAIFVFICGSGCTQIQIRQNADYAELRERYDYLESVAGKPLPHDLSQISYIVYEDSEGAVRRFSDADTKRILYIWSQVKYLPSKEFKAWYHAESLAKTYTVDYVKYVRFVLYSADGKKIRMPSIWDYAIIPESRIEEYLNTSSFIADTSLQDDLFYEMMRIADKYNY